MPSYYPTPEVLAVDCPKCGANAGASCHAVGAVTRTMKKLHWERAVKAEGGD